MWRVTARSRRSKWSQCSWPVRARSGSKSERRRGLVKSSGSRWSARRFARLPGEIAGEVARIEGHAKRQVAGQRFATGKLEQPTGKSTPESMASANDPQRRGLISTRNHSPRAFIFHSTMATPCQASSSSRRSESRSSCGRRRDGDAIAAAAAGKRVFVDALMGEVPAGLAVCRRAVRRRRRARAHTPAPESAGGGVGEQGAPLRLVAHDGHGNSWTCSPAMRLLWVGLTTTGKGNGASAAGLRCGEEHRARNRDAEFSGELPDGLFIERPEMDSRLDSDRLGAQRSRESPGR